MAEKIPKFMKQKWFPQPHDISGSCTFEVDDETLNSTIVPIAFYDEGLGAPSSLETHPENAAFAVVADQANCFVGSRINIINAQFEHLNLHHRMLLVLLYYLMLNHQTQNLLRLL